MEMDHILMTRTISPLCKWCHRRHFRLQWCIGLIFGGNLVRYGYFPLRIFGPGKMHHFRENQLQKSKNKLKNAPKPARTQQHHLQHRACSVGQSFPDFSTEKCCVVGQKLFFIMMGLELSVFLADVGSRCVRKNSYRLHSTYSPRNTMGSCPKNVILIFSWSQPLSNRKHFLGQLWSRFRQPVSSFSVLRRAEKSRILAFSAPKH